ncbi:unnamed protein product [Arabidopsis halleri]
MNWPFSHEMTTFMHIFEVSFHYSHFSQQLMSRFVILFANG